MNEDWSKCHGSALDIADLLVDFMNNDITEKELYSKCMTKVQVILDLAYENRVKE